VHWGMTEADLLATLPAGPRHVTDGYYVVDCTSLAGLSLALGFHFRPRENGGLRELEFFRRSCPDIRASYEEFQRHLEAVFGTPASTSPGYEDLPSCSWQSGGATVRHYVIDRFGPEEHVSIVRG
jgi:hypothetical protein